MNNENYKTSSSDLSAFLIVKNCQLVSIEPNDDSTKNSNSYNFVLEPYDRCKELENLFFSGAMCPASLLLLTHRELIKKLRKKIQEDKYEL